jgi:hypothetical protein
MKIGLDGFMISSVSGLRAKQRHAAVLPKCSCAPACSQYDYVNSYEDMNE